MSLGTTQDPHWDLNLVLSGAAFPKEILEIFYPYSLRCRDRTANPTVGTHRNYPGDDFQMHIRGGECDQFSARARCWASALAGCGSPTSTIFGPSERLEWRREILDPTTARLSAHALRRASALAGCGSRTSTVLSPSGRRERRREIIEPTTTRFSAHALCRASALAGCGSPTSTIFGPSERLEWRREILDPTAARFSAHAVCRASASAGSRQNVWNGGGRYLTLPPPGLLHMHSAGHPHWLVVAPAQAQFWGASGFMHMWDPPEARKNVDNGGGRYLPPPDFLHIHSAGHPHWLVVPPPQAQFCGASGFMHWRVGVCREWRREIMGLTRTLGAGGDILGAVVGGLLELGHHARPGMLEADSKCGFL
ncbi:hypothetical protein C8R44DRAFT_734963 [Mycena epipterygia]|nr:hypothetical protein C8R44DRAFT_734963 [Mycena epipterygia]